MTLLNLMLNEFMDSNGLSDYKCNLLDNLLVGLMSAMTNNPLQYDNQMGRDAEKTQ